MIQPTPMTRGATLSTTALAPASDGAAFGLSLDSLSAAPGQWVAAPGKPLPWSPTPVAPVGTGPAMVDTGVATIAPLSVPLAPAPSAPVPLTSVPLTSAPLTSVPLTSATPRPKAIVGATRDDPLDSPAQTVSTRPNAMPLATRRSPGLPDASPVIAQRPGTALPLPLPGTTLSIATPPVRASQSAEASRPDAVDSPRLGVAPVAETRIQGLAPGHDLPALQVAEAPIESGSLTVPGIPLPPSPTAGASLLDDGEHAALVADGSQQESDETPTADIATASASSVPLAGSVSPQAQVVLPADAPETPLPLQEAPPSSTLPPRVERALSPGAPTGDVTQAAALRLPPLTIPPSRGERLIVVGPGAPIPTAPGSPVSEGFASPEPKAEDGPVAGVGAAALPEKSRDETIVAADSSTLPAAAFVLPALHTPATLVEMPPERVASREEDATRGRADQPTAPGTRDLAQPATVASIAPFPSAVPVPASAATTPAPASVAIASAERSDAAVPNARVEPTPVQASLAMPPLPAGFPVASVEPHALVAPSSSHNSRSTSEPTLSAAPPLLTPPAAHMPSPLALSPVIATPISAVLPEPGQPEAAFDRPRPASPAVVAFPTAAAPAIVAGATAPAFRLFAQAIHAARRDDATGDRPASAFVLGPSGAIDPLRALPLTGSSGPALDMTNHRWPSAMIDRIEALRDAANATDTSIRLVPAALGTIDVSVRRDGDTVHVHFNAEQAATRTLLSEAQPRLAELAESRGLKLGQASVGAGADQNAQRQPAPIPARTPEAPASAARDEELETATTRVA